MKNILIKLTLLFALISGLLSFAMPSLARAAVDCSGNTQLSAKDQIQCGACDASGSASCNPADAPKTLQDTIHTVIDILSVLGGAVAVVMIIVGGFRYITSAGNAESTKSARQTIVYAIVGLIIIALAQIIVHFTLNTVTCVNGKTSSGQSC